jgi:seryl-tRNA synthetase
MSDPKELRRNAQDCVTHARAATDAQDKFLLLNMAQAWLKLSQQVEQLQAEREMVAEKLGDGDDRDPRDDPHSAG